MREFRLIAGGRLDVINDELLYWTFGGNQFQTELLAQVFGDAVRHRTPGSWCDDCGEAPETLCAADAADLDLADAYMGLAMALGIEVAR